jgi:ferritin-like metal-binding protein YciE
VDRAFLFKRLRAHPPAPAVRLLDQTLAEEKKTDETLSKIAEGAVNAEAA